MDSFEFAEDTAGVWHVTKAPHQVELSLPELCGANPKIITAQGRHLVICNEVRYVWTGFDPDSGALQLMLDQDDRET